VPYRELASRPDISELAVAGPTLMEHYVKKTRDECFDSDGFFHTGDAGYFDEDGYLFRTDRSTNLIISGGVNSYPAEVRAVSFLGDHYLYELDLDGLALTATDTRSFAGPAVTVRIPPSACRALPL